MSEFPLTMTDEQMRERYPEVTEKQMLVTVGGATYIKHCGEWVLLDPALHREGRTLQGDTAVTAVRQEAKEDYWNDPPEPDPLPTWDEL